MSRELLVRCDGCDGLFVKSPEDIGTKHHIGFDDEADEDIYCGRFVALQSVGRIVLLPERDLAAESVFEERPADRPHHENDGA